VEFDIFNLQETSFVLIYHLNSKITSERGLYYSIFDCFGFLFARL